MQHLEQADLVIQRKKDPGLLECKCVTLGMNGLNSAGVPVPST